MIISVSKARQIARNYLDSQDGFEPTTSSLHYLGTCKRRHAFEVRYKLPDNLLVDPALPIVLIVSAKEVIFVQSEESFEIMDYCRAHNSKTKTKK